jgi:hypothetical protein
MQTQPWHTLSSEQAFQQLESQPGGLSQTQAAARLLQYGPNELQARTASPPGNACLNSSRMSSSSFCWAATVLSLFLGHGVEALVIAVIVLFAVGSWASSRSIAPSAPSKRCARWPRPPPPCCATAVERETPARELTPGDGDPAARGRPRAGGRPGGRSDQPPGGGSRAHRRIASREKHVRPPGRPALGASATARTWSSAAPPSPMGAGARGGGNRHAHRIRQDRADAGDHRNGQDAAAGAARQGGGAAGAGCVRRGRHHRALGSAARADL